MTFSDAGQKRPSDRFRSPSSFAAATYHPDYAMAFTPPSPPLSPWSRLWPSCIAGCAHRRRRATRHARAGAPVGPGEVPRLPPAACLGAADRGLGGPQPALGAVFPTKHWCTSGCLTSGSLGAVGACDLARAQAAVVARRMDHAVGGGSIPASPSWCFGDLGAYGSAAEQDAWHRTQQRLQRAGSAAWRFCRCRGRRWPQPLSRSWSSACWERGRTARFAAARAQGAPAVDSGVERLLPAVPAEFVEPGLLRALRHLLPAGSTDASTEVEVYRHPDVRAADATGLVLAQKAAALHRQRFAAEEPPR